MRHTLLALLVVFGLASTAQAKEETLIVNAPADAVYTAALRVIRDMKFEIKTSDREAGLIQSENKSAFGQANFFLDVEITKVSDTESTVLVDARRRRLSITGGNPDERLKEFRDALRKTLGEGITVTEER